MTHIFIFSEALIKVIGATKGNNPHLLITEVQDIGRRLEEAAGTGVVRVCVCV